MTLPLPAFDRYRVELSLAKPAAFPFEHGGVLRGLLSRALGRHELPHGLIPFPCESGRVLYAPGDPYALGITLVGPIPTPAGAADPRPGARCAASLRAAGFAGLKGSSKALRKPMKPCSIAPRDRSSEDLGVLSRGHRLEGRKSP